MKNLFRNFAAIAATMAACSIASGALIAEFNYNAATSPGNATTGTGTTAGGFFPFSSSLPEHTGSPNDTNPVMIMGSPNNSSAGRSGPQIGAGSLDRGHPDRRAQPTGPTHVRRDWFSLFAADPLARWQLVTGRPDAGGVALVLGPANI